MQILLWSPKVYHSNKTLPDQVCCTHNSTVTHIFQIYRSSKENNHCWENSYIQIRPYLTKSAAHTIFFQNYFLCKFARYFKVRNPPNVWELQKFIKGAKVKRSNPKVKYFAWINFNFGVGKSFTALAQFFFCQSSFI